MLIIYFTYVYLFNSEEYRWMKVELRHLSGLFPSLNGGNVCPACPKVRLCSTIIFPFTYLQEMNIWVIVFASHTDNIKVTTFTDVQ